jgi:hypothetical protein
MQRFFRISLGLKQLARGLHAAFEMESSGLAGLLAATGIIRISLGPERRIWVGAAGKKS